MPPSDGPSAVECTAMTARRPDGASATNTTCSWPVAVISSGTAVPVVPMHPTGLCPALARFKVGVQLSQQDTTIDELRRAWREADDMGLDSIWVWDHFFPLSGPSDANHFEAYSLLGAMATDTRRARFGARG